MGICLWVAELPGGILELATTPVGSNAEKYRETEKGVGYVGPEPRLRR